MLPSLILTILTTGLIEAGSIGVGPIVAGSDVGVTAGGGWQPASKPVEPMTATVRKSRREIFRVG
jgi:hypothetical protein